MYSNQDKEASALYLVISPELKKDLTSISADMKLRQNKRESIDKIRSKLCVDILTKYAREHK